MAIEFDELSNKVIGCALEVHRGLGPGLLESAYERCLVYELKCAQIPVKVQVPMPVEYKGELIECGYRLDLLVDDRLIVELKAVEAIHSIHQAQLLTYMRLARVSVGLLINFNARRLKDGLKRMVL